MADEKKGYPKIPKSNWFLLRDKFKQRTPERVSPSYVATALGMGEASASANIIPPLRWFGLIDDTGKPTDLAYDWRDDSKYAEVCKQILEITYPQELRDLFHDTSASTKDVENWFARNAKVGQSAARAYAATYLMLLEADLTKAKVQNGTKATAASPAGKLTKVSAKRPAAVKEVKEVKEGTIAPIAETAGAVSRHAGRGEDGDQRRGFTPKLHVDIQIHISPDSSPEQIDKIFESMAKHLPLKS